MSKETNKGGRPEGIDTDFIHGISRDAYRHALVRGNYGLTLEKIAQRETKDEIERRAEFYKGYVKDVIEALAARGLVDPAKLKPTAEDKQRFNDEETLARWRIPFNPKNWKRDPKNPTKLIRKDELPAAQKTQPGNETPEPKKRARERER